MLQSQRSHYNPLQLDLFSHNLQHLHSCFVGGPSLRISRGRRKACRECGGGGEEEERSAQLWGKIQREHIPNHPANNGNGKMREKVGTRRIRDEQHKSQNAETRTRWRSVQQDNSANIINTNYDGAQTGTQYSTSINQDRSWEGSWDKESESGQLETSRAGWNSVWVL